MMAVVKFPSGKTPDEISDEIALEIDELFDYMDGRVSDGSDAGVVLAAMAMVLKMISDSSDRTEALH